MSFTDLEKNKSKDYNMDLYDCVVTHNSSLSIVFLNKNIPVLFYNLSDEQLPNGLEKHHQAFNINNFKNLEKKINSIKNTKSVKEYKPSSKSQQNIPSIFNAINDISI